MEMYELRYFLAAARHEHLPRAAVELRVSAASISKAIRRLEEDLGVRLFAREGRGLRLSDEGRYLQRGGAELVRLEESLRLGLMGAAGFAHAVIAGPEVLLARMGPELADRVARRFPKTTFEFLAIPEAEALERLAQGDVHLALIAGEAPPEMRARVAAECEFVTGVGRGHPLFADARAGRALPIERVLEFGFVSPSLPIFGPIVGKGGRGLGPARSLDGWRDESFPRRISHRVSSIRVLEEIVRSGRAVAYLPDYLLTEESGLRKLKITGCPYSCSQRIRYVAREGGAGGWLDALFSG